MTARILITSKSPGELLADSLRRARTAQSEIQRLKDAPLAPSETLNHRMLVIAQHADELADAFEIIDTIISNIDAFAAIDDAIAANFSPPEHAADPAPSHRGVHSEPEDPSVN